MRYKIKTIMIYLGLFTSLFPKYSKPSILHDGLVANTSVEAIDNTSNKNHLKEYLYQIALRESNNNPLAVSRKGFLGKYQFSPKTLWGLGEKFQVTRDQFLNNESLQDSAMVAYLRNNYKILDDIITKYDGKTYNGIQMSTSGILAGAHLIGPYGIRHYFDTSFKVNRNGIMVSPRLNDSNGVHVEDYIQLFADYPIISALE